MREISKIIKGKRAPRKVVHIDSNKRGKVVDPEIVFAGEAATGTLVLYHFLHIHALIRSLVCRELDEKERYSSHSALRRAPKVPHSRGLTAGAARTGRQQSGNCAFPRCRRRASRVGTHIKMENFRSSQKAARTTTKCKARLSAHTTIETIVSYGYCPTADANSIL